MSDPESKIKAISRETFNKTCADCPQKAPNYVNLTEYTFVCTTCSGMLRGLNPPHKVKALSMARFTEEDAKMFKERGNKYNREKYLSNFGDYETIPDKDKDPKGFMSFLEKKYSGRFSGARAVEVPVEKVLGYNKPSLVIQSGTKSDRGFGFCKNCGTGKLSDHDRFCHSCGAQQSVGGNSPSTTRAPYRDSPTTTRASQPQQSEDPFGNPASPRQDDGGFGAFSSAAPVSSKSMQPQTSNSHLLPGGQRLASVGSIADTLSGQEQQSRSAAMAKADFSLGLGGAAAAWGGKASPVIPRANVGAAPPAAAPSGGGGGGFGDFGGFTSAAPQQAAAAPPPRADDGFGDFASSSSASTSVSPPAQSGSLGLEGLSLGPPAPAPAPTGGGLGLDLAGLFAESAPIPKAAPPMQSQGWGMPTQAQAPPTSMGGWGMPAQAQAPPTSMGGWGMPQQQQPGMMQPGMPPQQGGWGMPPQQQGMGGMGGMPMQQQGMGMGGMQMGQPMGGMPMQGGMMQPGMPQQQGGWGMPAQQQPHQGMGGMGGMGGMPMQQQSMGGWGMPPQQQGMGMGGSIMDGGSTNEADAAKQKAEKSFAALDVFSSFGK